jgi:hypothetical protein
MYVKPAASDRGGQLQRPGPTEQGKRDRASTLPTHPPALQALALALETKPSGPPPADCTPAPARPFYRSLAEDSSVMAPRAGLVPWMRAWSPPTDSATARALSRHSPTYLALSCIQDDAFSAGPPPLPAHATESVAARVAQSTEMVWAWGVAHDSLRGRAL